MKKRWESYVMYRQNKKLVEFWKEYCFYWARALILE